MVATGDPVDVEVIPSFEVIVDRVSNGELAAVAVDMPMGLLDVGPRSCDQAARRLLGPRRASVFPAPPRAALGWASWSDARGVSRQAFNLLARIRELDEVVTPELQDVIVEAHSELAFARLAGTPMQHSKRTDAGLLERRALLGGPMPVVRGAAAHDVLDAAALLVTARHLLAGDAELLGGEVDATGRRAVIAW